ncbi:MAG: TIGR01777 family oxidoreductase [Anaerolineales bacterium]
MRWLLTGGTGMIGQALSANLIANGDEVVVLSRNPKAHEGEVEGRRLVAWDGATAEGWGHSIEGVDVVVNMAGERIAGPNPFRLRWTSARKERICDSRAQAGKALVQAIENASRKPAVLIQFSGVDYYPVTSEHVTEATPPGDSFLARICTECWEPSTRSVEDMGVRRVIVRLGPVLHSEDGALPPMIWQTRLFLGGPLGSGQQYFSWVHIDDVIGVLRFLAGRTQAAGAYNLTAPNPLTNAEFMKTLARVMKRPSFLRIPGIALKLLFGEMSSTLLKGSRVLPERLLAEGYHFRFPKAEAALRNLMGKNGDG